MELRVVTLLTVFTILPMILSALSTECSARVTEGGTAILLVNIGISLDLSNLMVEWECGEKLVHLFRNGNDSVKSRDPRYKGRTSLFKDEISRGKVSLKLMNVTEEDAGTYILTLRGSNIPDDQWKRYIILCVDKKTKDDSVVREPETPVWVMVLIAGVVVIAGFALLLFLLYKCRQRTSCWKQNKQEKGNDEDEGKDEDKGKDEDERKNPTSSDDQHKLGDPAPGKEPVGNEINGENPEERSRLLKEQPKKS